MTGVQTCALPIFDFWESKLVYDFGGIKFAVRIKVKAWGGYENY